MNQLQAMRMFTKVAESMSFATAAKQLGVSNAAATRSIAMLEAHLNMRLINRSTRHLSLTEAGRAYLEGCSEVLEQLDVLEATVSAATRECGGILRVGAPSGFAVTELPELLRAYRQEYPRVTFEVFTFDAPNDIAMGSCDVCFSTERRMRESSLVSRPLTQVQDILVASVDYLAQRGTPRHPQELADHDILFVSEGTARHWEFGSADETYRVKLSPAVTSPNVTVVKRLALAGLGIARLPASLVAAEQRNGVLLPVLAAHQLEDSLRPVSILYSGRRYLTHSARSFIDFTIAKYRSADTPLDRDLSSRRVYETEAQG
jgi:DNA-binding transcriptional LysR family regulator